MNHPRYPLRINVGFLLKQSVGYTREIHFEFPEITLKPDFPMTDFTGVARVTRTPQGIFVQGEFQGKVPADCVRCLTPTQQPIQAHFEELYAFDHRSVTESNLLLPDDANIDLEPLVREYLLIEVPISPRCREDCRGLCPVCGENLNEGLCEHMLEVSREEEEDEQSQ